MRVTAMALTASVVLAVGCLSACSPAPSATPSVSSAAAAPSTPADTGPHVGDPVTLTGNSDGSQMEVTVEEVTVTTSKDRLVTVGKRNKLVAVKFRIANTGTAPYEDAPSNGAVVVDSEGRQFGCTIVFSKVAAGALLPAAVKVKPGGQAEGYLLFEVPKAATVAEVRFAMDSGYGEIGRWEVP